MASQGETALGLRLGLPASLDGEVNLGVGTLATSRRPANVATAPTDGVLCRTSAGTKWELGNELRMPTPRPCCRWVVRCPVLPDRNWALIGDAAGCVNPLNGEGIDYGLETGRVLAELMAGEQRP